MANKIACFIFLLVSLTINVSKAQTHQRCRTLNNYITIRFELVDSFELDSLLDVKYSPILNILGYSNSKSEVVKITPDKMSAEWSTHSDKPIYVSAGKLDENGKAIIQGYLLEPGDIVVIKSSRNGIIFEGNNTAKFELQKKIKELEQEVKGKPSSSMLSVNSFESYFSWNSYLNKKAEAILPIIDSFKSKMTEFAWREIRINFLANTIQYGKCLVWSGLRHSLSALNGQIPITHEQQLAQLFDRDLFLSELVWLRAQPVASAGSWDFIKQKVYRDCFFSNEYKQIVDASRKLGVYSIDLSKLYIKAVSETYTGIAKESCIASVMCNNIIRNGAMELGFPVEYDKFLEEYYNGLFDSDYKEYVRQCERRDRSYGLKHGYPVNSYFSLFDLNGNKFDYKNLTQNVAYIHFWETTKKDSKFEYIYTKYQADTNVTFINIFVGNSTDAWKNAVRTMSYNKKRIINLSISSRRKGHPLINALLIDKFPHQAIVTAEGLVFTNIDELDKNEITSALSREISRQYDGPYVFSRGGSSRYFSMNGSRIESGTLDKSANRMLKAVTDKHDKTFALHVRNQVDFPASEYERPENLLVLSDIEGNFDALRKLLQHGGVIDDNFNWTFDSGHLVFAGDMFDRGFQVTECLWLIYSLEEKAKAAGGNVHFILGNHEIMNLQGNHKYVELKYKNNAGRIGKTVTELYNEDSELGKWLRTKNIIEKIGDLLFVHGGISPEINRLPLTLEEMNNLARPFYAGGIDSANTNLLTLFDTRKGKRSQISPFWSRAYYYVENEKISLVELDSTLNKFQVNRIITGHTIVSDTISVHYSGKVINTDTRHASGKSEALLIKGYKYYRINQEGIKVLLFEEERRTVFKH